jgi:hypothetical protein
MADGRSPSSERKCRCATARPSLAVVSTLVCSWSWVSSQSSLQFYADIDYPQPQNCSTDFFSQKKPIRILLKSRKTLFKITIHYLAADSVWFGVGHRPGCDDINYSTPIITTPIIKVF